MRFSIKVSLSFSPSLYRRWITTKIDRALHVLESVVINIWEKKKTCFLSTDWFTDIIIPFPWKLYLHPGTKLVSQSEMSLKEFRKKSYNLCFFKICINTEGLGYLIIAWALFSYKFCSIIGCCVVSLKFPNRKKKWLSSLCFWVYKTYF